MLPEQILSIKSADSRRINCVSSYYFNSVWGKYAPSLCRAAVQALPAVHRPVAAHLGLSAAINHAAAGQVLGVVFGELVQAFEIVGVDGGAGFDFDGVDFGSFWH
jgi:hypothetical protein